MGTKKYREILTFVVGVTPNIITETIYIWRKKWMKHLFS